MAPELLRHQWRFSSLLGQLLCYAGAHGIHVTGGHWWRSPLEAVRYANLQLGIKRSLHCDRLAVDLNIFSDAGDYLTDLESYRELGEYWESLGGAWGGKFKRCDPGHFSLEWQGRK